MCAVPAEITDEVGIIKFGQPTGSDYRVKRLSLTRDVRRSQFAKDEIDKTYRV